MAEKENKKKPTFEEALSRLETIVNEMESGKLSLEEMMARFDEGNKLAQYCTTMLNEVEKKIEVLVKKGNQLVTEPFEPEKTEEP